MLLLNHLRLRRGSYIAEAAVVLPFVILSIITTVLIVMYFYESSVSECRMHMALRCESGLITEKTASYSESGSRLSPDDIWDGSVTVSGAAAAKRVHGSVHISMAADGLLSRVGGRDLSDDILPVDPAAALRIRQIAHPQDYAETVEEAESAEGR